MIGVSAEPIDPPSLLAAITDAAAGAGAVASFTGIVRGSNDGSRVETLWLDHHERLTIVGLEDIAQDARDRFGLIALTIVHRVGEVRPAEPIVFVAAAAVHRREAFDAVDYMMDRLKTDAPLWKSERRGGKDYWIEARPSDHSDRARWE